MSKINKIRLSGTDYDIQDVSATSVVEVTQQQYDDLPASAKTDNILYIITDSTVDYVTSAQTQSAITQAVSGKVDTSTYNTYTAATDDRIAEDEEVTAAALNTLNDAVSGKQDTLVSGINIKTINNESLLGSGNIDIQGGGVDVVQTTGTSTTDVMSQDAVTTQLNNKANKTAAVGGYKFGSTSGVDYLQYRNVNNDNIGNSIYYPKINGKGIFTNNSIFAQNNYNFQLVETSAITSSVTSASTDSEIPSAKAVYDALGSAGGGITSGEVETMISAATSGYTARFDEDEEVTAAGLNALNDKIDSISGANAIEVTQAEYDALVTGGTVDPNAFYIITDATEVDISQYWTSAQTQSAITQAVSGKADADSVYTKTQTDNAITAATSTKQDTLVSGTNIKTINNESILGSGNINIQGGSTYSAGRGISLSNNTIAVSLPISAGTGTNSIREIRGSASGAYSHAEGNSSAKGQYSHAEGEYTNATANHSHSEGYSTYAQALYSHVEGQYTIANNQSEHASGQFNVSNKANNTWGDGGNTLFSVGNGTSNSAKHNAFEIRQNGDIYLSLNGQDVKLQDQLGGSSITIDSALSSTSENPVQNKVIYNKIDEVEQVTAAGLNTLNDALGGMKLVKLTQTEYDNLSTKDSNTLYLIVN